MKKVMILIFVCVFCFGCEAKYHISINEDLSVTENITGLEDDDFYNNYYKSTKERVIEFMAETSREYLDEIGYTKEIVKEGYFTGAKYSKTFSSLDEYFEKSKAYTQFYDEWEHKINNGVVTISLENQLLRNEDSIERYVIDNCDISITLPFKVKKSNADYVDKSSNTYSWQLNSLEGKDIYIKFDTTKMADYKESYSFAYVIVGIIVLAVIAVIYVIYDKNKSNNKI